MEKKTNKGKLPKNLKKTIFEILIASEDDFRPYIEILNFTPENIAQSQLGSLLGIFEIKDDDESSAYIVNFLSSVAKKEYFTSVKKSPAENFESTLNKVNLALSEIAKHGNIEWMGKLDMAICALEENNLHFSVSGKARVILIRDGILTDISNGLSPEIEESSPLKTFTDTASGELENNDKIIITTDDIFQILSLNEIKKRASQFSKEQFTRFLKTALVNELEIAGTIIIDASEEDRLQHIPEKKKTKAISTNDINAFSEKTFRESSIISSKHSAPIQIKEESFSKSEQQYKKEYTDKKTGHIYVHGENQSQNTNKDRHAFYLPLLFTVKEEIADIFYKIKIGLKNKSLKIKSTFPSSKKFFLMLLQKIKERFSTSTINLKQTFKEKIVEQSVPKKIPIKASVRLLSNFLPSFSKIKTALQQMNYQQKIYALLILIVIIIVPLITIMKFKKEPIAPSSENIISQEKEIDNNQILSNDKNAQLINSISSLYSHPDLISPILTGNKLLAITEKSVIEIKDDRKIKEFPIHSELGHIISATLMKDLNLVLLLTDRQKIVSFSPISNRFHENNIELLENSNVSIIATYLTYIYLTDYQTNQIYRYPRAEGGFGEKTDWLKENLELKNISDMAVDGNVYLTNGDSLSKFSTGKKLAFSLEESVIPINFNKIFTSNRTEYIYILDSLNGRLVKFDENGRIIIQHHNRALKEARNFSIDEKNNKVYLVTINGELISFDL